jgi:hypothetical protein
MSPTRHTPEPLCVGRDDLCRRLIDGSLKSGITLFFGGPKSGKRTTINRLVHAWPSQVGGPDSLKRVPVLLDLQKTPAFEDDRAFYHFALLAVRNELQRRNTDLSLPTIAAVQGDSSACQWFFEQIRSVVGAAPSTIFHIVLIVHRFDYLLGQPFSKVLERNMVSFFRNSDPLTGRGIGSESRIGLILSGGAKLYAQSRNPDTHSPLRGVHEREYCLNLTQEAVQELVRALANKNADAVWVNAVARRVFTVTGGQATLARQLAEALVAVGPASTAALVAAQRRATNELGEIGAQLLHDTHEDLQQCGSYHNIAVDVLRDTNEIDEQLLRAALRKGGASETLWRHAMESVGMCGFAQYDRLNGALRRCNDFFWPDPGSRKRRPVLSPLPIQQTDFIFSRDRSFPKRWIVIFRGKSLPGVGHRVAFIQIAALLRSPGRSFAASQLDNLVNQSPEALDDDMRRAANELKEAKQFSPETRQQSAGDEKTERRERIVQGMRDLGVPQLRTAERALEEKLQDVISTHFGSAIALTGKALGEWKPKLQARAGFNDEEWDELNLRLLCIREVLEEREPGATGDAAKKRDAYKRVSSGIDRAIKFFEQHESPELGLHLRAALWPDPAMGQNQHCYCYKGEFTWTVDGSD